MPPQMPMDEAALAPQGEAAPMEEPQTDVVVLRVPREAFNAMADTVNQLQEVISQAREKIDQEGAAASANELPADLIEEITREPRGGMKAGPMA